MPEVHRASWRYDMRGGANVHDAPCGRRRTGELCCLTDPSVTDTARSARDAARRTEHGEACRACDVAPPNARCTATPGTLQHATKLRDTPLTNARIMHRAARPCITAV
uniref:Uncharacterized protein n=1 Tax=Neobacillus citreus TaxID=2833578 RepID=A0A942YB98_9BACI